MPRQQHNDTCMIHSTNESTNASKHCHATCYQANKFSQNDWWCAQVRGPSCSSNVMYGDHTCSPNAVKLNAADVKLFFSHVLISYITYHADILHRKMLKCCGWTLTCSIWAARLRSNIPYFDSSSKWMNRLVNSPRDESYRHEPACCTDALLKIGHDS